MCFKRLHDLRNDHNFTQQQVAKHLTRNKKRPVPKLCKADFEEEKPTEKNSDCFRTAGDL